MEQRPSSGLPGKLTLTVSLWGQRTDSSSKTGRGIDGKSFSQPMVMPGIRSVIQCRFLTALQLRSSEHR
jgi:hypothetical protein